MFILLDGPSSAASRMLVYVSVKMSHAPSTMDRVPSVYDLSTRPRLHRGLFWFTTVPMQETTEHCCAA
jgi:hypothetical protein